jgi:purine-binding chemotaxis protein CheW
MESANKIERKTSQVEQYLTFLIASEEYAINILKVKEILEFATLTTVPNAPLWIRGVINLRGNVVPVVDLSRKFGMASREITKFTCIVITEVKCNGEILTMGLMADSVSQVIDLAADDIQPPPAFGTRVRLDYLQGMGKVSRGFCLILDSDKVLSSDELLSVEGSSQTAELARTSEA